MKVIVTFKAKILVNVASGDVAEIHARLYLQNNPSALKMVMLSYDPSKIKRFEKEYQE